MNVFRRALLTSVTLFSLTPAVLGQQPAPVQPNPQAPTLNPLAPLGIQRGTRLDLTIAGTNLADPVQLWTGFPAKVNIPTDSNNGKDAAKLRVQLEVPGDAPVGAYPVRLMTARGLSNLRLFCVDDLPQVLEVDTNRSRTTPQVVPVPCVVVGRADAEVSDWYKLSVRTGQRVSFDVLGRRLGSAFDPQLTLFDARTGREVPGGYSNDSPGCQTDPRMSCVFKEGGDYLIEIRDVMWRGGADYMYRLRIGEFPLATAPVPMAVKRGSGVVKVQFAGPLVEGVAPIDVSIPTDPAVDTLWVTPRGASNQSGWPVALAVSDFEEVVETEPNNDPAKASRVPVPGGITGRFQDKGDVDQLVFAGKKGQRLVIEAHTQELYSPTEVYMVLKDAKGAQLAASNPAQGARLDYTPTADGDLTLTVEHLHYWGGPSEIYRVTVTPYEPGFSLTVPLDRFDLFPGGFVNIPVVLAARRDYTGPIEVSVVGPAGLSGTATIAANAAAGPQPAARVLVTAKPDLAMGPNFVRVQGKATINAKPVVETASVRAVVSTALGALPYPPRDLTTVVGIGVTEKPPFTLTAKIDLPEAIRGAAASVTISAVRAAGFDEEITLAAAPLPANVAAALKPIPKGASEVKVTLTPAAAAALGSFPITITGKAKQGTKEFTVSTLPVSLVVALPFDLKVEPAPVKLAQGDKVKLKVTATRKGGHQGPINLEVRNLPAGVTATKATIAMDQTAAEIELTAAPTAAVADKADVNVQGTATAAANQQNASANFTVSVTKK